MIKSDKTMILGVITTLLLVISCHPSEREHRDKAAEPVDSAIDITTKAKVATADIDMDGAEKAFVISTYSQSLYVTELANIAAKSSTAALRDFAKKITPSYQKMIIDMEKIAKGKGLLLERNLSETQQKELNAIKELSSPTLDQQVLQKLQTMQAAFTTVFKEAQHLQNHDLNVYASDALHTIHQQQAETTKLVNAANPTGSQSTRPGEVATP